LGRHLTAHVGGHHLNELLANPQGGVGEHTRVPASGDPQSQLVDMVSVPPSASDGRTPVQYANQVAVYRENTAQSKQCVQLYPARGDNAGKPLATVGGPVYLEQLDAASRPPRHIRRKQDSLLDGAHGGLRWNVRQEGLEPRSEVTDRLARGRKGVCSGGTRSEAAEHDHADRWVYHGTRGGEPDQVRVVCALRDHVRRGWHHGPNDLPNRGQPVLARLAPELDVGALNRNTAYHGVLRSSHRRAPIGVKVVRPLGFRRVCRT
jgi:hypothetical protein